MLMSTKKEEEPLSEFAQAIAERPKGGHEFDLTAFFGLAGKPLPKALIRRPTSGPTAARAASELALSVS